VRVVTTASGRNTGGTVSIRVRRVSRARIGKEMRRRYARAARTDALAPCRCECPNVAGEALFDIYLTFPCAPWLTMTSRLTVWRTAPPRLPRPRVACRVAACAERTSGVRGDDAAASSSSKHACSVLVIGASGRTGKECVRECIKRGIPVRAGTRSGLFDVATVLGEDALAPTVVPWSRPIVEPVLVDVTKPGTVDDALVATMMMASEKGIFHENETNESQSDDTSPSLKTNTIVIFCATANSKGDPEAVDRFGLVNLAKACVFHGISRLVVVSGAGVTAPNRNSPAYAFLNRFGGRMDAKRLGEAEVLEVYSEFTKKWEEHPGGYTAVEDEGNVSGDPGNTTTNTTRNETNATGNTTNQTRNDTNRTRHETRDPESSYTILRPSGLVDTAGKGPGGLSICQNDLLAGFVSRQDVGACAVSAGLRCGAFPITTFRLCDLPKLVTVVHTSRYTRPDEGTTTSDCLLNTRHERLTLSGLISAKARRTKALKYTTPARRRSARRFR
jgi:hypothetical protein